jgi:hypothetical protein
VFQASCSFKTVFERGEACSPVCDLINKVPQPKFSREEFNVCEKRKTFHFPFFKHIRVSEHTTNQRVSQIIRWGEGRSGKGKEEQKSFSRFFGYQKMFPEGLFELRSELIERTRKRDIEVRGVGEAAALPLHYSPESNWNLRWLAP